MVGDGGPGASREMTLALIYDSTLEVIFLIALDGDEFRFDSVNRAFLTLTGLTRERVVGQRVVDVLPPSSHELVLGKYREAIATRGPVEWEEVATFPAGRRVGHVRVAPVIDASGRCTHLVGTVHDITSLRQTEELLLQAQKMEAVGRLAGGVAHDFNNILTVIFSHVELLSQGLRSADPLRQGLVEIGAAAERAANLTRQLLAFSRQQVMQPKVLSLNHLVGELEDMLRRLLGEDVELRCVLGATQPNVLADGGQVEQVVLNLAVNARDAMPNGGRLTIETANVELDPEYCRHHPGVVPGSYVMMAVTDTGVGMDRATQIRVFEPFFTTKPQGKGTGLGLPMVLGIVKQSGGHIWVYSEPGKGTTFKVYFPLTDRRAEVPPSEAHQPAGAVGNETILLVEDETQLRIVMRGVLKRRGYQVLDAQNGGEALLLCERFSGPIHLLLTDVVMPQMSGKQVAERLRELRPSLKVLYVSGYTDDAIVHHGILDPGASFLEKPFQPDALARKVREVLDRSPTP